MSTAVATPLASVDAKVDEVLAHVESLPGSPKITADIDQESTHTDSDDSDSSETSEPEPEPEHGWGLLQPAEDQDHDSNKSNCGSSVKSTSDGGTAGDNDVEPDSTIEKAPLESISTEEKTTIEAEPSSDARAENETEENIGVTPEVSEKTAADVVQASVCQDETDAGSPTKAFFTSDISVPVLDTIHEHGCVKLNFGDYADLFVEATGTDGRAYVFEVQSDIIAAASTVFHKMVYETHNRGTKAEWKDKWVWELNDSAIGLKILFSILHYKYCAALFAQEPRSHQVYEVLRVLKKYGISDDAFQPYVKSWTTGFRRGLNDTTLTQLECLYTSYKLGDFKSLKVCVRKVAHEIEIGENGAMCLDGKPIQEIAPIADQLVANIRAVRSVDIKTLLDPLQTAYDELMGDTEKYAVYCKSQDGHDECNEKLLGSLLKKMRNKKLRPIPAAAAFMGRCHALAMKVSEMDVRGLYVPQLTPHHQRHSLCRLDLDKVANEMMEHKVYLPLYDHLVEEMVVSAQRAGVIEQEKTEFEDYKSVFNAASIKYEEEFPKNPWGWDEGIGATGSSSVFHFDDSGIDKSCTWQVEKGCAELGS